MRRDTNKIILKKRTFR